MKFTLLTHILATFLFLVLALVIDAQPLNQTQYIFNHYLYNPIWAGYEQQTQLYVGYKKQWVGFEGAPALATATFEKPLKEELAVAGQLNYQTEGPFNQVNVLASSAYQLRFSSWEYIRFGLSLGFENRSFNVAELSDPSDPAVVSVNENSSQLMGNLGFGYFYEKLFATLSLPRLFPHRINEESGPNAAENDLEPTDYWILGAGYVYELSSVDLTIKPQLLYHSDKFNGGQLEILSAFYFRDVGLAGISYRQDVGISISAGINVNEKYTVNYVYGIANDTNTNLRNGFSTHDIGVRMRFVN